MTRLLAWVRKNFKEVTFDVFGEYHGEREILMDWTLTVKLSMTTLNLPMKTQVKLTRRHSKAENQLWPHNLDPIGAIVLQRRISPRARATHSRELERAVFAGAGEHLSALLGVAAERGLAPGSGVAGLENHLTQSVHLDLYLHRLKYCFPPSIYTCVFLLASFVVSSFADCVVGSHNSLSWTMEHNSI